MALVQMRTPQGSYSMVDEAIVSIYEKQGWVLTSELPEFKTKDVTYYDEARQTVTSSKGEEKPVKEVIKSNSSSSNKDFVETITATASGKIRTLTNKEYEEFKKIPIEEKRNKIAELAAANIFFRANQKEDLERTYRISGKEFDDAVDIGITGEVEVIESGPLNSGINTWWQLLGYDSIDEVNKEIASGALTAPEIRRAKDNAEEKRTGGSAGGSVTPSMFGPPEMQDIITTVTVSKGGKIVEIPESDLHLYKKAGWSTDINDDTSDDILDVNTSVNNNEDADGEDLIINEGIEKIGETQVVVYGPNGARTTANTFKRPGEEMSEYDRLIAGLIPGREGYKNATKSEELTADYAGDYGGEDASTPMDQRESVVGIGNTDYDPNDYSSVGQVVGSSGNGQEGGGIAGSPGSTTMNQFNNIPEGAVLVQSDEDKLYLMYTVPGAGTMYKGLPIRMFYEVRFNDLVKAGLLTKDAPYEVNYFMTEEEIDDFIVAGTTSELPGNDPNTGQAPHPFLTFVDNLTTQAQIAPWLLDKQSISLLAEAALEGREVSEAEWRVTDWYQEHSQAEREWLRTYYADPSTATALKNDYKIQVSRALQAAGVTGGFDSATGQEKAPPDALVSWIDDDPISDPIKLDELKDSVSIALKDVVSLTGKLMDSEKSLPDSLPEIPRELSFWIAAHLGGPVASEQQNLLELTNTFNRLEREYELLDQTRRQLAARTALKDTFSNADQTNM